MMYDTELAIHDGEVLTGRYYQQEGRLSYTEEKQAIGEMPEDPLAEQYHDDDYEWERSYDMLDAHK